jgi:hypothetical protein
MKKRTVVILALAVCAALFFAGTAKAAPRRWRPYRRAAAPVVVTTKPRVVVTTPAKKAKIVEGWGAEKVTQESISPEVITKRNIKPDQGLIDLDVYPSSTKIYLDGVYKGRAGTLNKDRYSLKATEGRHTIELKKKSAPTKIVRLKIVAGQKTCLEQL